MYKPKKTIQEQKVIVQKPIRRNDIPKEVDNDLNNDLNNDMPKAQIQQGNYQRTTWINEETKLNSTNLNNIEDGIYKASENIEELKNEVSEVQDSIDILRNKTELHTKELEAIKNNMESVGGDNVNLEIYKAELEDIGITQTEFEGLKTQNNKLETYDNTKYITPQHYYTLQQVNNNTYNSLLNSKANTSDLNNCRNKITDLTTTVNGHTEKLATLTSGGTASKILTRNDTILGFVNECTANCTACYNLSSVPSDAPVFTNVGQSVTASVNVTVLGNGYKQVVVTSVNFREQQGIFARTVYNDEWLMAHWYSIGENRSNVISKSKGDTLLGFVQTIKEPYAIVGSPGDDLVEDAPPLNKNCGGGIIQGSEDWYFVFSPYTNVHFVVCYRFATPTTSVMYIRRCTDDSWTRDWVKITDDFENDCYQRNVNLLDFIKTRTQNGKKSVVYHGDGKDVDWTTKGFPVDSAGILEWELIGYGRILVTFRDYTCNLGNYQRYYENGKWTGDWLKSTDGYKTLPSGMSLADFIIKYSKGTYTLARRSHLYDTPSDFPIPSTDKSEMIIEVLRSNYSHGMVRLSDFPQANRIFCRCFTSNETTVTWQGSWKKLTYTDIETGLKNAQDAIDAQKTKVTTLENKTKTLEQQISSLENLNRINTNPVNFDIGFTASEQAYVPLFTRVAGSYRIVNNICYVSLEIGFNQTGNWNFSAQQYPYPLVTKTKLPKPSSLVMLNMASEGITPIGNCIYLGTRHENNVRPSLDDNGTSLFLRYIKPEDRGQWYKTMFDYPIDVDHWLNRQSS